jgi:oligopeptide/dipeptide ABC transporter ATP-binding protein
MIFQEPMTALNPLYTVEKQVSEVLKQHGRLENAETNKFLKIAKAIISPIELLVNYLRNDWKGALPIIIATVVILGIHQTNNADETIGLLASKFFLFGFAVLFLWIVGSSLFPYRNNKARDTGSIGIFENFVREKYSLLFVSWIVIIVLLWIPFGVLMTIILSVAILAIPPIQLSSYFSLDSAHRRQVVNILKEVRIPNPEAVVKMYPHELSGGMRQRVMIAMMMACEPKLLIADEPTTALDVTIQAQILNLMKDLRDREGTAIMMITHDLGVIAETCDAVTVMYAGSVVETGSLEQILGSPRMPYTIGLLHSIPRIKEAGEERVDLPIIPGQVPDPNEKFDGCRFHPRCPFADKLCRTKPPQMLEVSTGHFAACHHTDLTVDLQNAQSAFSSEEFLKSGGGN